MYKKKLYFFVVMSVIFSTGLLSSISAQTQLMPSFTMKLTNGKIFSSKELSPQKPVIIIYFAPDCDHCQVLMNALFKKINEFKRSEIVMVTFQPLNQLVDFEKTYQTAKYSNIKVGTEAPIFFFRTYYHLENTPFTVLFDKHGKQIISYKKETPVDDLIKHLKLLK
jgi:thioredoxin-related protein